jgi:hypothetical protein
MDDKVDTGYKMKVREAKSEVNLVRYACCECGNYDVESKWYCTWDVHKQAWIPCDRYEDEDYCNDCADQTCIEEQPL